MLNNQKEKMAYTAKLLNQLNIEKSRRIKAENELEQNQERIALAKAVERSPEHWFDMGTASKMIDFISVDNDKPVGRNTLMKFLKDARILMRKDNTPYQQYINNGWFTVTAEATNGIHRPKTLISLKGIAGIKKKLIRNGYIPRTD
ncbi:MULTISPECIES: phage antirepressor KilAC domain-containing protein [Christensenella]|uniref:phage antirepressor KilAC domain-containing protein n=1 Tax=Christensenella TaxID=990721 RepID=UPI002157D92C|nr:MULTISPECIES: phage antirepressor KilAC domain-containing protein [Christensenella]